MSSLAESQRRDDAPVIATRAAYEASAAAWAGRWQDKGFIAPRFDRFREMTYAGARVLDLGCGPGLDAREHEHRGLRVIGLDVTRAMLDYAIGTCGLKRAVQGDLRALPFPARTFDGVWASASLLHLPKAQAPQALQEVARVLAPGGAFYSAMKLGDYDAILAPRPGGPVQSQRYFAHYQAGEWARMLTAAGFEAVEQGVENADAAPPDTPWLISYSRLAPAAAAR